MARDIVDGTPLPEKNADVFTFGRRDKSVHFDLLELHVRDQVFPLTLMEANLLRYLIQHEGKPVSRKTMLEEVWGLHEDTDTRADRQLHRAAAALSSRTIRPSRAIC